MTDMNAHLDEGMIHAWLDGALAPDESARAEAHVRACPHCAARVAEARGLIAASSRILASLDAVPSGVIPGTDTGADQLALLRARKHATSRRWWSDRRVVAAASLLFIAGTFSVVWRESDSQPQLAEIRSAVPTADSASPAAVAPRGTAPPSVTDAVRAAKAEAPAPPLTSAARLAANQAPDSSAEAKVAATGAAADVRAVSGATNEMARRVDVGSARQEQVQAPAQVQVSAQLRVDSLQRQQAVRQQFGFQGLSRDTGLVAAAQAELRARNFAAAPAVADAAPKLSDAPSVTGCYVLRSAGGRSFAGIDSVKLLDEMLPVLSDPTWFRAVRLGVPPDTSSVAWRAVDSVTVELRERIDSGFALVRFTTTGVLPDVRAIGDVRAAVAVRCRAE
jgi:hypothetical protein